MNRVILFIVVALASLAPARTALADDPAPTQAQLDAAKKAFEEGKALHDAGNLPGAIGKFKESYRLSRNPLLLYNIGFTADEAGKKDEALLYYRKFLSDAPAGAPQRATVADRVKALEKEKLEADLDGTAPATSGGTTTHATAPEASAPTKIKPPGTYGAKDFEHQTVDEAPPGKPLDITAYVPKDSGFQVTLYYRGGGEAKFTSKPMKWRYKELVARIPAAKMAGKFIQYYIEVQDQAGNDVTRSGKSTSPNLVNLDPGATPKFYPDWTDEGGEQSVTQMRHHDEENPLGPTRTVDDEPTGPVETQPTPVPEVPGQGFRDVGSQKFKYVKWGTTAGAATFVGLSIAFYALAGKQASSLTYDSTHDDSGNACSSPCRMFDSYDKSLQDAGHRYQTLSQISLGIGLAATAVAGYYWYRELTAKKHGEVDTAGKASSPEAAWVVAPSVGPGFTGAAAAVRF